MQTVAFAASVKCASRNANDSRCSLLYRGTDARTLESMNSFQISPLLCYFSKEYSNIGMCILYFMFPTAVLVQRKEAARGGKTKLGLLFACAAITMLYIKSPCDCYQTNQNSICIRDDILSCRSPFSDDILWHGIGMNELPFSPLLFHFFHY